MPPMALALTPGEPAGIGPDVTVQLVQRAHATPLIAYSSPDVLLARAQQLGLPLVFHRLDAINHDTLAALVPLPASHVYLRAFACDATVIPGKPDVANAAFVLRCLEAATVDCLAFPESLALVTGPIQKSLINDAGMPFSGHTEFLQALAGVDKVVMMLATRTLRVALVTTHMALRDVADAITADNVRRTLDIVHADLQRYFTGKSPRILVCGLNPHAGEGGHLGTEERDIVEPVLQALIRAGMDITGPVPADTAFTPDRLQGMDVVVAMYHDQGLPVLKAQGFGEAINITLGLPFVRTSVDHGTALDLAGTGLAKPDSLGHAVNTAAGMLQQLMSAAGGGVA